MRYLADVDELPRGWNILKNSDLASLFRENDSRAGPK